MISIFQKFSKKLLAPLRQNTDKALCKYTLNKELFCFTANTGKLRLKQLFFPLLLELIFNNLLNTINTAVLSSYSNDAVIASGSVAVLFSLFNVLFSGLATGTSVIISNYLGAKKHKNAFETSSCAIILSLFVGLLCFTLLFFSANAICNMLKLSGEPLRLATLYIKLRSPEFLCFSVSSVILGILRCYGHAKYTVLTGIFKNLLNVLSAFYAVRFAVSPFLSGISGVAIGSLISQFIVLLICIRALKKEKITFSLTKNLFNTVHYFKRIIQIGIPTCLSSASYTISQIITNTFATQISNSAISAKLYFTNILCYAYLFSSAMGNANSILTGWLFGAKQYERADKINRTLLGFTIPVNFSVSVILLLIRVPLISIFTSDKKIVSLSLSIFILDLFTELARAVSHIYEYSLRGTGDVTVIMTTTIISGWALGVGLSFILSIPLHFGLTGCYVGFLADETIRAVVSYLRWKSKKWIPKGEKYEF